MARQLAADDRMMPSEELPPGRIPQAGGQLRRTDDVGEEDRRQDPLGEGTGGQVRNEARRRGHGGLMGVIVDPGVDAPQRRQFGDLGAADPLRRIVARARDGRTRDHERRDPNCGEDVAHVEFHRGPERREGRTGAEATAHVPDEPVAEGVVPGDLWAHS